MGKLHILGNAKYKTNEHMSQNALHVASEYWHQTISAKIVKGFKCAPYFEVSSWLLYLDAFF